MVYLSIEDDTKDLYSFVNSPGGWVVPGVAIYDTMQFVRLDVHTICMGLAASMRSFILGNDSSTRKLFLRAQTGEFLLEAEELLKLRETLTGFMYNERANLYGYIRRFGKGCFYVSNRSPSSWNC
ncbi:ATP-dependent Clp protease proteolytic subunit [Bienertia sinuspersici]